MEEGWRITPRNPVRDLEHMDFERCAALHNEIIERGWIGAGRNLDDLYRTTYTERFHNDPHWQPEHLHAYVEEFFRRATAPMEVHTFFYTVNGPVSPEGLLRSSVPGDDAHRFLKLYSTTLVLCSSHRGGIVLDQLTARAIFQPSDDDFVSTMFGRAGWWPLEVILESFLDMMDQGKALALPRNPAIKNAAGVSKPWEPPWILPSFTEVDLRDALWNFERLVEEIETRMPPGSLPENAVAEYGCPDLDTVFAAMPLENTFARLFLAAMRRPRFRFIAPGLVCVGAGTPQPFSSPALETVRPWNRENTNLRPILLAHGEQNAARSELVFRDWFKDPPDIPCGLYLTELDNMRSDAFEDGCRLVLPYQIGQKCHGRRSHGTFFGERRDSGFLGDPPPFSSSNDVHQQGYNPFVMSQDAQLKHVLERWVYFVEFGYWEVDENGVVGGIEKWREADSEAHWGKYQLPMHW